MKVWEDIQLQLTSGSVAIPVYFAYESATLLDLYQTLKDQGSDSTANVAPQGGLRRMINNSGKTEYIMILNLNEPKVIPSINLDVIYVSF
jgi:FlaG/FlaF family flagellin (archaellin)